MQNIKSYNLLNNNDHRPIGLVMATEIETAVLDQNTKISHLEFSFKHILFIQQIFEEQIEYVLEIIKDYLEQKLIDSHLKKVTIEYFDQQNVQKTKILWENPI